MSDKPTMSNDDGNTYLIPHPFPLVDALLHWHFVYYQAELLHLEGVLKVTRRVLTFGSCEYHCQGLGFIYVRQAANDQTFVRLLPIQGAKRPSRLLFLRSMLAQFWAMEQRKLEAPEAPDIQTMPMVQETSDLLDEIMPFISPSQQPREPRHGDSIDTWLDWRDEQFRTGGQRHALSLPKLAESSGHKLDALKRRSAARKRQQPNETE